MDREEAKRRGAESEQLRFAGLESDEFQAERRAAWEEALEKLANAAGVDLDQLGFRKSDPSKVLLAAAMKQTTLVSNAWLANRLSMGQPASASQFAQRLQLTKRERRWVQRLL